MEYQKIINVLENISNQPSRFKIENWIEINAHTTGTWNTNSGIRFSLFYVIIVMHTYLLKEK